jgi:hypothetical protein
MAEHLNIHTGYERRGSICYNSHRKGTTQQSAAIMASLSCLLPEALELFSFAIKTELQIRTITAMITNTSCQ